MEIIFRKVFYFGREMGSIQLKHAGNGWYDNLRNPVPTWYFYGYRGAAAGMSRLVMDREKNP